MVQCSLANTRVRSITIKLASGPFDRGFRRTPVASEAPTDAERAATRAAVARYRQCSTRIEAAATAWASRLIKNNAFLDGFKCLPMLLLIEMPVSGSLTGDHDVRMSQRS
jgi:hypothetical protein